MDVVWKPHKKQTEFLSLPDTIFEALYGGSAGGGKSDALIMLPIIRGFYKEPRFKGIIFRRTYPELESEIIVRTQNGINCLNGESIKYSDFGAKYNSEKRRWTFPSGAIVQFGHVEYESDVRKYDTAEYNYMAFDELTSFSEFQYIYLSRTRCRSSSKLPAIVRGATNPGNVGHAWVRRHFIEPAPYGSLIVDKKTGLKRIFIQAKPTDNPHLDPNYVQKLSGLPEAERRAKLDGDWWTFEGQVFEDFRADHFPDEPDNALHVIPPQDLPSYWPRILAIDWGFSANTVALWGAVAPNNRLYIYREYVTKKAKISEWASEIGKSSHGEEFKDLVLCQSAWQNRGEDLLIAEQFEKYSGLRARPADNRRIHGKMLLQEYLRWSPKPARKVIEGSFDPDFANKVLRSGGIERYKEYLGNFEPEVPEVNLPKLQIFNTCPELIKTIPLCVYADKDRMTGKPAEDVKEFVGDDSYDCVRYLIEAADRFVEAAGPDGREKVEKILHEFAEDKNWTRFHRRMEHVERTLPVVRPVRRFHRGRVA